MDRSVRKQSEFASFAESKAVEELKKLRHDYGERVKELSCLYGFSKIVETPNITLDGILKRTNRLLPKAWQYPEIACSRIVLEGREFRTNNFKETKWRQRASVKVHCKKAGFVEVCYLEEKPAFAEGPFLKEERHLIDAMAERLGRIIERKNAEEAVRASESRYKGLYKAVSGGLVVQNVEGEIIEVNDAACEMLGLTRDEISGRTSVDPRWQAIHEDGSPFIGETHPAMVTLKTGRPVKNIVMGVFDPEQEKHRWILINSAPIFGAEGKMSSVATTFLEITERKRAEEALIGSEKRYRRLFETSQDGIMARDLDGKMLDCNQAYARMLGYSKEELFHLSALELMPEKWHEQRERINKEVLETGGSAVFERKYRRKDGVVFPASVRSWRLADDKGKIIGVWSIVRDITHQKELERQLQDYAANLEKLVEERTKQLRDAERLAAIGATAGMVGHDIRNPLQSIVGDVFLAKSDVSALPESEEKKSLMENLESISGNVEYINKIVQDLQDFARPITPAAQETDLQILCEAALFKNGLPDNIEGACRVEKNARRQVTDPALLTRILGNLVSNSVEAMPKGGKLYVHAFKEGNDMVITVEDTGCGIRENVRSKLFTPLFTTKSKGQGFGLAVVKRVTEALGGTVTYESEVGKGTKFILRLPPPKEISGKWNFK